MPETTPPACTCGAHGGRAAYCDGLCDIARVEAEAAREQAELEARLLPEMPPAWHIASIAVRRDRGYIYGDGTPIYDALLERDGGDYEARGSGETPAAAVRAAMKEIG